jgi:hypothetical protein
MVSGFALDSFDRVELADARFVSNTGTGLYVKTSRSRATSGGGGSSSSVVSVSQLVCLNGVAPAAPCLWILDAGDTVVDSSAFVNNSATDQLGAGAIAWRGQQLTMRGCAVERNAAQLQSGAVQLTSVGPAVSGASSIRLLGSVFEDNSSPAGGSALYLFPNANTNVDFAGSAVRDSRPPTAPSTTPATTIQLYIEPPNVRVRLRNLVYTDSKRILISAPLTANGWQVDFANCSFVRNTIDAADVALLELKITSTGLLVPSALSPCTLARSF